MMQLSSMTEWAKSVRTNLYSQKVTMVQGYKCCWSLEERQLVCVSAYVLMLAREDEVTDFFIVFSFGNQVNRSVIVNMPFSLCCHSNKDIYTKVLILSRAQLCYYTLRIFSFLSSANCYLVHWSFQPTLSRILFSLIVNWSCRISCVCLCTNKYKYMDMYMCYCL